MVAAGIVLSVVGRWLSYGRPHRQPDLAIVAFFLIQLGHHLGGIGAGAGAITVYTRLIRPRPRVLGSP